MRALPRDRRFDAIVAMPMHWRRRWERGFNQAELLAREVSRRSGIRYESVLRRTKATPPQAGLTGSKRRKNVAGAFAVTRPDTI
ncbi:ComF family protein, partial [Escherichia coli]